MICFLQTGLWDSVWHQVVGHNAVRYWCQEVGLYTNVTMTGENSNSESWFMNLNDNQIVHAKCGSLFLTFCIIFKKISRTKTHISNPVTSMQRVYQNHWLLVTMSYSLEFHYCDYKVVDEYLNRILTVNQT